MFQNLFEVINLARNLALGAERGGFWWFGSLQYILQKWDPTYSSQVAPFNVLIVQIGQAIWVGHQAKKQTSKKQTLLIMFHLLIKQTPVAHLPQILAWLVSPPPPM